MRRAGLWRVSTGMLPLKTLIRPLADRRSCYNAFSRLDMRIHVSIPGTVESFCVDERGEKRKATDELWLETYLCSVLRAYSYADDGSGDTIRRIIGVRRFNPVTNTETEHRFLNAAEQLFFRGKSAQPLVLTSLTFQGGNWAPTASYKCQRAFRTT